MVNKNVENPFKLKGKQLTIYNYLYHNKRGLNKFEAAELGDTCINTTASVLGRKGVKILREPEILPNRFGGESRFIRYKLIK